MDNSCFYYGVHTAGGNCLGFFDSERVKKIIAVCGGAPLQRESFFVLLSAELFKVSVKNELLFSWNSVSALYCPEQKILVADLKFLNEKQKSRVEIIIELDLNNAEQNEKVKAIRSELEAKELRCQRFLAASDCIKKDMLRLDALSVDKSKLLSYTARLWKKSGGVMKGTVGMESKEFVSCVTSEGVELNERAFEKCDRVAVIVDKTGAVSLMLVDRLRRYALSSGYDVISCVCSLNSERVEHVIIPELRFGVFSSEHYHRLTPKRGRKIYAARFHTKDSTLVKNRLNFSLKAYRSLMNEAFCSLAEAEKYENSLNLLLAGAEVSCAVDAALSVIE